MNKRIKSLWVKALRSGNFTQGVGNLCLRPKPGDLRYCCLGVLTKLYLDDNGLKYKYIHDAIRTHSSEINPGFPVAHVIKWAGLHHSTMETLSVMNDGTGEGDQVDFNGIADYIEKKL